MRPTKKIVDLLNEEFKVKLLQNNIPLIDSESIIKGGQIGEGSFGRVYKGKYGKIDVAIKKLKLKEKADINEIINEIQIVSKLKHNRVPMFYGVWKNDQYFCLIFDCIDGVTLKKYLKDNKPSNKEKYNLILQLLDVIEFTHSQSIIHRDIKPENIMINENNVYVIDFGVSKIAKNTETFTENQRGTTAYFPPENCDVNTSLSSENSIIISQKFDVWSIGCIISYMMSGVQPWGIIKKRISSISISNIETDSSEGKENKETNTTEIIEKCKSQDFETKYYFNDDDLKLMSQLEIIVNLTKKKKFPIPENIPSYLSDVLKLCFEYDPKSRISISEFKEKLMGLKDYYC